MWQQIWIVTLMNLRQVPKRLGMSSVVVIGTAGVVAVLVSVLAMAEGFRNTVEKAGHPERVMVLRQGATSELVSNLSRDAVRIVTDTAGIARDSAQRPIASPEALALVEMPKKNGQTVNVLVRGAAPAAFALRPEVQVVEGRAFTPGRREIMVGKSIQRQVKGANIGDRIRIRNDDWIVVGRFSSNADAHESELWADAETLLSALGQDQFQSLTIKLDTPGDFENFKSALMANPAVSLQILSESEYHLAQTRQLTTLLFFIAYVVGGIMAIGATFGALNTMYFAISARTVEIATLRAIGFGAIPVVVSVLVEALVLTAVGAIAGVAVSALAFHRSTLSSVSGDMAQIVFPMLLSADVIAAAVVLAALVGLLGGVLPALRAARVPIAKALRGG